MHVCLFDIDGTLLASGGAGKAAMESALASAFGVPADSLGVPYSGRTDRSITQDLFRKHGIDASDDNWRRFLSTYLEHLPGCLARHQGRVLPGVADLLGRLTRHERVVMGLLTGNVRHGARLKLGHYGLDQHFRFGGFGDHHFDRNDVAREAKAEAHRHHGEADLESFWVIGDTPLDIACARHIGARIVAVATGWHPIAELAASAPDVLLTDLSDPAPLLELWR